jgi:hypothetical protein
VSAYGVSWILRINYLLEDISSFTELVLGTVLDGHSSPLFCRPFIILINFRFECVYTECRLDRF